MPSKRWTTRISATLLGTAAILAGCAATTSDAAPPIPDEQRNADIVRGAFERGVGEADTFYAILADDVQWTVARAPEPTTYTSRQQFLDHGAKPIVDRLTGSIQPVVHELVTDRDRVVARWRGTATALDGRPYVNEYNWVMAMENQRVIRVVAYLDFVVLDELIERVPLQS
ncbi:nuclear transport factor 2 family protein [Mycolicibacterium sp. XJ870]